MEKGGITINKTQEGTYTQKEKAYLISNRDWKRLKKEIEKLKNPSKAWSNAAWGSLGVGLSCCGSWITTMDNSILIIVGAMGFAVAICCFCGARSEKNHDSSNVDKLKEIISDIEEAIIPQGKD